MKLGLSKMNMSKTHFISYIISFVVLTLLVLKLVTYFQGENPMKLSIDTKITQEANDIVFGNNAAEISIIMFGNYKCSHCISFFKETLPTLVGNKHNKSDVKVVLKLVPLSEKVNELNVYSDALCIYRYGEYEKFHEMLIYDFNLVNTIEYDDLMQYISQQNEAIASCRTNNNNKAYIHANKEILKELGVKSTPTFIIEDRVYKGNKTLKEFQDILNEVY